MCKTMPANDLQEKKLFVKKMLCCENLSRYVHRRGLQSEHQANHPAVWGADTALQETGGSWTARPHSYIGQVD